MPDWPDCAIIEVSYDKNRKHIVATKGYQRPTGGRWGASFERTRTEIVYGLKNGVGYCTSLVVGNEYKRGPDVVIVLINGREYIKTEKNNIEADNLGELPEF